MARTLADRALSPRHREQAETTRREADAAGDPDDADDHPARRSVLTTVGRPVDAALSPWAAITDQLVFYGRVLRGMPAALRYRKEIIAQISDITVGAGALVVGGGMFFVIFAMAFFTGSAVGLQGFKGLQQIGAEAFTGVISSVANTREITPLIAGVALAAQVGAGFTAQIGAMRISDEVDALEVMGVRQHGVPGGHPGLGRAPHDGAALPGRPLRQLPGHRAHRHPVLQLSPGVYRHYFNLFLPPIDIFASFVKALLFAVVVALIHCYYGYTATGGPAGVGQAAGRAIRISIITVVVLNLVLSLIFWGGSDTARIVG